MIDGKIDYSKYSREELIDVLCHVDPVRFPLNHANAVRCLEEAAGALPRPARQPEQSASLFAPKPERGSRDSGNSDRRSRFLRSIWQCVLATAKASFFVVLFILAASVLTASNVRWAPQVPWSVPVAIAVVAGLSISLGGRWSQYQIGISVFRQRATVGYAASGAVLGLSLFVIPAIWAGAITPPISIGADSSPMLKVALGFTWVILAGIYEEIGFRGILQGNLEAEIGRTAAILVSTVIFVAAHFYFQGFRLMIGELACLGLAAGIIASRTRSIWPGALIHVAMNATVAAFTLPFGVFDFKRVPEVTLQLTWIALAVGLVGCIVFYRASSRAEGPG